MAAVSAAPPGLAAASEGPRRRGRRGDMVYYVILCYPMV